MSHSEVEISGDLPKVIGNEDNLYEGNLTYYFQVLFFRANNLYNPYHNFRHMTHVLWLCYKACEYYSRELPPRQMRALLIAALFHDFESSVQHAVGAATVSAGTHRRKNHGGRAAAAAPRAR